jgi:hypothetical protein
MAGWAARDTAGWADTGTAPPVEAYGLDPIRADGAATRAPPSLRSCTYRALLHESARRNVQR